eukprot:9552858-Ditylum_brightwellii.AAC.1
MEMSSKRMMNLMRTLGALIKQNPVRYLRVMSIQLMRTHRMLPLMNTTTIRQPQNIMIIGIQTQTTMKMIPHTMILDCHRD